MSTQLTQVHVNDYGYFLASCANMRAATRATKPEAWVRVYRYAATNAISRLGVSDLSLSLYIYIYIYGVRSSGHTSVSVPLRGFYVKRKHERSRRRTETEVIAQGLHEDLTPDH